MPTAPLSMLDKIVKLTIGTVKLTHANILDSKLQGLETYCNDSRNSYPMVFTS